MSKPKASARSKQDQRRERDPEEREARRAVKLRRRELEDEELMCFN